METTKQEHKAILVMDMQVPMVSMLPDGKALAVRVADAIEHARKINIPVIYVVVGFRQGMPEVGPANKGFYARKQTMAAMNMDEWMKIDATVAPKDGEVVVVKRRISAFTGSDLEVVLRAKGIQHLVFSGIATSGVVLSTLRESADKDYRITVLSNGCADLDSEVHTVLMNKVFPRQADVITIEEWCKQ
jgi:nicotinamidase-related amidase